ITCSLPSGRWITRGIPSRGTSAVAAGVLRAERVEDRLVGDPADDGGLVVVQHGNARPLRGDEHVQDIGEGVVGNDGGRQLGEVADRGGWAVAVGERLGGGAGGDRAAVPAVGR